MKIKIPECVNLQYFRHEEAIKFHFYILSVILKIHLSLRMNADTPTHKEENIYNLHIQARESKKMLIRKT